MKKNHQKQITRLIASIGAISFGVSGCVQKVELNAQAQGSPVVQPKSPTLTDSAGKNAQALVNFGPRVTGTPVMEKASAYLVEEYRRAGYVTEIQTFTYPKFEDLGSSLTVNGEIQGRALNGSPAGKINAPLIAVPNFGRAADFAAIDVKGAIALVRRGEIRFSEKARNAANAGAAGLVIINNDSDNFSGALGEGVKIPVLALSGQQGQPLLRVGNPPVKANLNVNTRRRVVTGRNVIAHLEGVTQPTVLLGGHYDSVPGSPGANDNASGTAVVLAIARNLSSSPIARQTWFVAFDGEEDGLHGSRAFVSYAQPQFLSHLKGMLNFDMVGANDQLRVGGTPSLTALAQTVDSGVATFGSSGGSDHASFAAKSVPILFFYRGQDANYHTPNDKSVNPRLLDETTQFALNIVKQLTDG